MELWSPLLSHIVSHRLPPATSGGPDCKVPEETTGADPALSGLHVLPYGPGGFADRANFLLSALKRHFFLENEPEFFQSYLEILVFLKLFFFLESNNRFTSGNGREKGLCKGRILLYSGVLVVTFLNKQVANVSSQWWSYCLGTGQSVFLVEKNQHPSKLLLLQKGNELLYNLSLGK